MRTSVSMSAILLLAGNAAWAAPEAPAEPPLPLPVQEKDFRTFLSWFEGEFDSGEQVAFG